jgi:hypothetical protein
MKETAIAAKEAMNGNGSVKKRKRKIKGMVGMFPKKLLE